jgi:hypothetical protein
MIILRVGLKNVSWSLDGPSSASQGSAVPCGGSIIPMQIQVCRERQQDFSEGTDVRPPHSDYYKGGWASHVDGLRLPYAQ